MKARSNTYYGSASEVRLENFSVLCIIRNPKTLLEPF